jgi:Glyoxalase/Bleomycin resistance protein/Dioxygenase superfamily
MGDMVCGGMAFEPAVAWIGHNVGQVGIIVSDLEATATRFSRIWGNGPWRCWEYGPELLSEQIYKGRPTPFSVRIALNSSQPQIELLQPVAGPSIYHDWCQAHGEGVHHLAIHVESLDVAIESMREAGLALLQLGRGFGLDGDGGFAYFDTESQLGVVLEAIELPARRVEPELVIP